MIRGFIYHFLPTAFWTHSLKALNSASHMPLDTSVYDLLIHLPYATDCAAHDLEALASVFSGCLSLNREGIVELHDLRGAGAGLKDEN